MRQDSDPKGCRRRPSADRALSRAGGLLALAAGTAAGGLLFSPAPAGASESPTVSSQATAFQLTLPKLALAGGYSSSDAYEGGTLRAEGAGVLEPVPSGQASATASPGHSQNPPQSCGGGVPAFPAPFSGLVSGSVSCGAASAQGFSAHDGTSTSSASAADLGIDLAPLLSQVVTAGSPLESGLKGLVGTLPPLPAAGQSVSSIISSLSSAATSSQSISIAIGPSSSVSRLDGASYTTTAEAKGSVITLMPGAGPGGAPLARIVVGGASATATAGGRKPQASDLPALVTVEVDTAATGPKSYSVVPGQSLTILAGTPLQSTIKVGSGSVSTAPSGAETASAEGVEVDLAEGVGATPATAYNGGLELRLAAASATSKAPAPVLAASRVKKKAPARQPLASSPVPNATTPHTGLPWAGAAPLLAGGALTGTGLLSWPWLKRRLRRP